MDTIEVVNVFGKSLEIFNVIYPIGYVYPQYPGQKNPNELWGEISEWKEIDYGGAFFRAAGGNADAFSNQKSVSQVQGSAIVVPGHGASVGCVVYDTKYDESRIITGINGDTLYLNAAFSHTDLTFVLITQKQTTALNGIHGVNTGVTVSGANHRHNVFANNIPSIVSAVGFNDVNADGFVAGSNTISTGNHQEFSGTTGCNPVIKDSGNLSMYGEFTPNVSSNDSETRPDNFSFKVWKRVN